MNAGKRELLCSKCRKRVSYQILKRPAKTIINDLEIEYEEFYGICDECKAEIYVPGLEDQNEERLEEIYRKKKGLITVSEIRAIIEKYHIEKRPLSKLLGFGELTITRYMDGQLPSKKYSDILLEILADEQKMNRITTANKDLVSSKTAEKVFKAIEANEKEKNFANDAERIALYIIASGRGITNLLLQKVLYYVKAISYLFDETPIILEPCEAWKFGPVFPTVYDRYKEFGKQEINSNLSTDYVNGLLSEQEKEITDFVLNTFGIYNAWFLMELTHAEEPWKSARGNLDENDACQNLIDDNLIRSYFRKMNNVYNLKVPAGVNSYVNALTTKALS